MVELVLDVRRGVTADALLGALVEAGASLEAIDAAVAALGQGDVRLQVQAAAAGSSLRIRAPHGAPTHETWGDLRPRVALLAVDDAIVDRAVALLDALFGARAAVHGVAPRDVDVDPFSGPDDLANAVALAAAVSSLGVDRVVATAVGHGDGTISTIEGDVVLPGLVAARLLADHMTIRLGRPVDVVDAVGAAFVATCGAEDGQLDLAEDAAAHGRGRLPDGTTVSALLLSRPARHAQPA